ncbi:hypothetical protein DERF_009029, partial [Dermatophagoides farinae]
MIKPQTDINVQQMDNFGPQTQKTSSLSKIDIDNDNEKVQCEYTEHHQLINEL